MLDKLYEKGYFDYLSFINDNAKLLSLGSDEALVLIRILKDYKKVNNITPSYLAEVLPLSKAKAEKAFTTLLDRRFCDIYVAYENGVGVEKISLQGFFDKAEIIIGTGSADVEDNITLVIKYLNEKLNRTLTSSELDIINSLVIDDKYTLDDIKKACEKITNAKKVISMRSLAQALAVPEDVEPSTKESPKVIRDFFASIK